MITLCNVFTTSMLKPEAGQRTFRFSPLDIMEAHNILVAGDFEQAVGHPATCEVLSQRLALDIRPIRANVRLEQGDKLIVAQVVIPRLAEGEVLSKEQVEACPIQFWLVEEQ